MHEETAGGQGSYLIALEATVLRAHTRPRISLIPQPDWKINSQIWVNTQEGLASVEGKN